MHQSHGIGAPAPGALHGGTQSKRRNRALAGFVQRLTAAGKPPKVILIAIARKLLVFAYAVIRKQAAFVLSDAGP